MPEIGLKFVRKNSFFHRIDPMTKLFFAVTMGLMIFLTSNINFQIVLFIISLFVTFILARVSFKEFLKPWLFLGPIIFGTIFFTPIIMGKTPIFPELPIPYYAEGLRFGVFLAIRWATFFITGFAFIWSTHPRELVQGLAGIGVPYTGAHALEIAFAYLPVIDYEARVISYSQKIRQVGSGKNIFKATSEKITKLMLILLLRGIKHAQTLAIAMNSRGYGAYDKRNYMDKLNHPKIGLVFRYGWLIIAIVWISYGILSGGPGFTGY